MRHHWHFGDGAEGVGGPTIRHTYAAAGEYAVRLAVTDNENRTGRVTVEVVVE